MALAVTASAVEEAGRILAGARRVVVLTGAGVSAESGLATFRGAGGLWEGRRVEEVATPEAFERDPASVWRFYDARRVAAADAAPNPAHLVLASMEASGRFDSFVLVTQNVDGLHRAAGSRRVLEIHGSLWRVRCVDCGAEEEDRRVPLADIPPRCACGGLLRPAIVWFGEPLPADLLEEAFAEAAACDACFVVGTSALVHPAASIPLEAAAAGAAVVEVNPDPTPLSARCRVSVRAAAGDALPAIRRAAAEAA